MNQEGEMGVRIHLSRYFFYYVTDYSFTIPNTAVFGIALRQEAQNHSGFVSYHRLCSDTIRIAPDSVFISLRIQQLILLDSQII